LGLARQSNRVVRREQWGGRTPGSTGSSWAATGCACQPRLLAGAERDRVRRAFVEMHPQAENYTWFTRRALPLVALEPERT